MLEIPLALHNLMSESVMMSVFSFTIPYIFKRWLKVPTLDIFNVLQFIELKLSSGKG
jgi:hypothetical protein